MKHLEFACSSDVVSVTVSVDSIDEVKAKLFHELEVAIHLQ